MKLYNHLVLCIQFPLIVNLEFISGFSSVVLSSSDEQDRIDNPIKSVSNKFSFFIRNIWLLIALQRVCIWFVAVFYYVI